VVSDKVIIIHHLHHIPPVVGKKKLLHLDIRQAGSQRRQSITTAAGVTPKFPKNVCAFITSNDVWQPTQA
jgi:hypothetical protein